MLKDMVSLTTLCALSLQAPSSLRKPTLSYTDIAARRARKGRPSNLPSSRETAALLAPDKQDLFTPDAWEGMLR